MTKLNRKKRKQKHHTGTSKLAVFFFFHSDRPKQPAVERHAAFEAEVLTSRKAAESSLNLGLIDSEVSCLEGCCPCFYCCPCGANSVYPQTRIQSVQNMILLTSEVVVSGLKNRADLQVDLQQVTLHTEKLSWSYTVFGVTVAKHFMVA